MPCVTDDDSKATKRIAEIEQQLQDVKAELEQWLAASRTPTNAVAMAQREREGKAPTDRLTRSTVSMSVFLFVCQTRIHISGLLSTARHEFFSA